MNHLLTKSSALVITARKMATKSSVVAPLANRFFLFNYFEKPPVDEVKFVDHWSSVADYVATKEHFISTHLHRTENPDTRFQWVNYAVVDSDDICVFGKPDPEWGKLMKAGNEVGLSPYPGKYCEIASFRGNPMSTENRERPEEYRFLVTAVTMEESVSAEDLEANWTSWTGAQFLQDQLKENKSLGDSSLYKFMAGPRPLIRYTVRTELTQMDDKQGQEVAESMNKQAMPEGIQTYTGFYKVHTNRFSELSK